MPARGEALFVGWWHPLVFWPAWRRRAPLALVALSVLAACGSGGRAGTPGSLVAPGPREPVQALLRERARALTNGDVEGYLRPLSAEARAVEEPIARGALAVPLDTVDFTIGQAVISEDGRRFRDAAVTLVYRYQELPPDNSFRIPFVYDLEERAGSWIVTRSQPTDVLPLWATGPVRPARSSHFLALSRPQVQGVDETLALAERARAEIVAKLTLEPDLRHLLVLAANPQEFGQVLGSPEGSGAAESLVAATRFDLRASAASSLPRPESRDTVANVQALFDGGQAPAGDGAQPEAFALEVFRHELAHLALSRFTRGSTPAWVAEGGAMLLAGERRVDAWRQAVERGLLDTLTLAEMFSREAMGPLEHGFANAATFYLVERHGEERYWDFYQNFKEFVTEGPQPVRSSGAERLLRRYYRFGVEELDGFTREWIRRATP